MTGARHSSDRQDVLIVGAGLAGLTAAGDLHRAGLDVLVVERADAVGGRVRTDQVDGMLLDRGFQLLNPAYPRVARDLDLDALELCQFQAGAAVQYDPSNVQFVCPCHGGVYDARTGAVLQGPPPAALQAIPVHLVAGQLRVDR